VLQPVPLQPVLLRHIFKQQPKPIVAGVQFRRLQFPNPLAEQIAGVIQRPVLPPPQRRHFGDSGVGRGHVGVVLKGVDRVQRQIQIAVEDGKRPADRSIAREELRYRQERRIALDVLDRVLVLIRRRKVVERPLGVVLALQQVGRELRFVPLVNGAPPGGHQQIDLPDIVGEFRRHRHVGRMHKAPIIEQFGLGRHNAQLPGGAGLGAFRTSDT
jgi:hypothetical protein